MRIVARVSSWLEATARTWAAHWLLITGGFLFCASLILRWVNFPLSRSFNALQLSFGDALELAPHYHLASYGVYAAIILTAGLAARRLSWVPLVLASIILITVFVALPYRLAFEQPAVLHRLSHEISDVSITRSFTRQYLPQNYGYTEEIPSHLELSTALGRALAAASFLGLGWACFGLSSALISFYAFAHVPRDKRVISRFCLCLPCAALALLSIRPIIGQHYFVQARIAQAQGYNDRAIADYRKAMWWDRWFAEDINTYATIGDLQRQANLAQDSPERHIKRAMEFEEAGQYEAAIFELSKAVNSGGSLALTARREAARTQVEFGLALYRAGAIGSAVINWEQSLANNPVQIQVLVFLARANYDLARYQEAVQVNNKVVDSVGRTTVLANAYSLAGDCYTKLGDDDNARRNYSKSITLDNLVNLWAITGLAGN